MPSFDNIGLQEPSTITAVVAAVQVSRGSTVEHQEIMVLGDSETSNAIARVVNASPASTDWALVVREAVPQSTTVNVSSLGGVVSVAPQAGSTWTVRAMQSSAADLNVTVAGYVAPSTVVTVSTGSVRVHQSTAADFNATVTPAAGSTWTVRAMQSSAADLNVTVAGYVAPSTTVNVSSLAGRVAFAGFHAGAGIVNVTDSTNNAINVNVVAGAAGGSTVATISRVQDSSNNGIAVADSVNNAIRVNVVAGAAGGSTEVTVRQSTAADLQVTATQGGVWAVTASTGSVRVHQSTAADLNVTVAGYSTTVNVSSVSGAVIVRSSAADMLVTVSTGSVRVHQSTAADLNVTVAGYSTTVNVSSVGGLVSVAQSPNWDSTCASGTKSASGDTTILSSGASTRIAIFGYSFSLASTTPTLVRLVSSGASTTEIGRWLFQAPSSITVGANMAVSMPGYLCQTAASGALILNTDSTATVHYTVWAYRKS